MSASVSASGHRSLGWSLALLAFAQLIISLDLNIVFVAIMTPAMFLMGVGPVARWKKASLPELAVRLRWAFAASAAVSLVVPLAICEWRPLVSLGLLLALWIAMTAGLSLWETAKRSPPRSYYGMQLAHVGVAVSIAGITIVTGYQSAKDVRLRIGETVNVVLPGTDSTTRSPPLARAMARAMGKPRPVPP